VLPLAVAYAAANASPAAAATLESVLLVYGPLGVLAAVGIWLGRRLIQSEGGRADRAEARVGELSRELRELNREVRAEVVPRMTEANRLMAEVLVVLRDRDRQ
jgi:hypothetical protein